MTAIRTEPFVPLTAAPGKHADGREFRVTVLPQAGPTRPFHAMESVGAPTSGGGAAGRTQASGAGCEPVISVQRDGDRIASIRIQCACGQVIDLACLYPDSK
jgi:hypothetical protein